MRLEAVSDSELRVQWKAPEHDGGSPISKYRVEWDINDNFDSKAGAHAQGSAQIDAIDINGISEVQYVTTSATANDLGGTFTLTYHGQRTEQLPFDVSSEDMRNALMGLCTIDDVSISREIIGFGHTWMITFNSVQYAGDLNGN